MIQTHKGKRAYNDFRLKKKANFHRRKKVLIISCRLIYSDKLSLLPRCCFFSAQNSPASLPFTPRPGHSIQLCEGVEDVNFVTVEARVSRCVHLSGHLISHSYRYRRQALAPSQQLTLLKRKRRFFVRRLCHQLGEWMNENFWGRSMMGGSEKMGNMLASFLTLIIINVIVTVHLQWNGTIRPGPSFNAITAVFAFVQCTLAVTWASIFAAGCQSEICGMKIFALETSSSINRTMIKLT